MFHAWLKSLRIWFEIFLDPVRRRAISHSHRAISTFRGSVVFVLALVFRLFCFCKNVVVVRFKIFENIILSLVKH